MDFQLSADQEALRDLAKQIITDRCTNEHLIATSSTDTATDLDLWQSLADAGLVGIGLPEAVGGGGYGWLESAIVLSEIGRAAAPVPALAVIALAGPALIDHPDLLDGVASGSTIITAAIHEPLGDPWNPSAAVIDGRLTGTKVCVSHGLLATRFVVTAADGLYVVEADAQGVDIERQDTTTGVPDALIEFTDAPAVRVGGTEATAAMMRRGLSAATVMTAAACEEAVRLTAEYAVAREQFDKPIASFQAVSQRVGNAYIDTEAVRLTAWHAAWRLDHAGDGASHDAASAAEIDATLLSAKFWSADGGWRVIHAPMHVIGGVGADRDYPVQRYLFLHKQLELTLGSATPTLARLGKLLAR